MMNLNFELSLFPSSVSLQDFSYPASIVSAVVMFTDCAKHDPDVSEDT